MSSDNNNFIDCTNKYKLDDNNLNCFTICTPARVGSSTWYYAFEKKYSNITLYHYHDLNRLRDYLNIVQGKKEEEIIVYGIRNPIEQILSNMMVHHDWTGNTVRFNNRFNGQFIFDKNLLSNNLIDIIKIMKKNIKKYSYITDWSIDFFNIIKFNLDFKFDKNEGFQILKNNNITYIFYRTDKINSFKQKIKELTGLELGHDYKSVDHLKDKRETGQLQINHDIPEMYKHIKDTIKFDVNYLNSLVDNKIYKYFYTTDEIKDMIEQYNENI